MMGGMGAGILGGALGQTTNQLGQAFQSIVGTVHSAKESRKAREWAEKMMRVGPALRVQGLKEAGLNPILAAGASYAGLPAAGMMGQRGGSGVGGAFDITSAQQVKNMRQQNKLLKWDTIKAKNEAVASEYLPQRTAAFFAKELAEANSARYHSLLMRAGIPRLRGEERFYGHTAGESMQRWNLFMRNLFGAGPKMPIYRGK